MEINLMLGSNSWLVRFWGGIMPQGQWIPLPFTPEAPYHIVSEDMHRRFPDAKVKAERDQ